MKDGQLLPQHRKLIADSAISPEVAKAREKLVVFDNDTLISLVTAPMQSEARSIVQVNVAAEAAALRKTIEQERKQLPAESRRSKRSGVA